ncbi:MAG: radical SAM protein [Anaerolineae bacterium]|nr:radical SAM protein [Anaerolineae bacterium]
MRLRMCLRRLRLCLRRGRAVDQRMSLLTRLREAIRPPQSLPAGLQGYERRDGAGGRVRLHLRVEPDGRGLLVINAARVLHLNQTAVEYARFILEGVPEERAVRTIRRRYRVDAQTAQADYRRLQEQIETLIISDGSVCPIHGLGLERIDPFSVSLAAPYRMDLALTYRCNNNCPHCYVARPPDYPEMDTAAWRSVLERVWEVSIPHVCFTGGEATLREDLVELVAHAEGLGLVTGLLTHGRRLSDGAYVQALIAAGLDHVQITLESHNEAVHDSMVAAPGAWRETVQGVQSAVAAGLYTTTNTTLTRENVIGIEETVAFIASLGVPTFACNSLIYAGRGSTVGTGFGEGELVPILERVREAAGQHGLRLIWYTPTQYCAFSPLQLELGVKACTAALYNMCVEPDGAVIPCQSYYERLGYILRDPWEDIWNHDLAQALRERRYAPEKCQECPEFPLCGGGCPLYLRHHWPEPTRETPPD